MVWCIKVVKGRLRREAYNDEVVQPVGAGGKCYSLGTKRRWENLCGSILVADLV
jgi:hypothetical protein